MKAKKRDKAVAQFLHARRRARERYGIILNHQQYQQLCNDIQAGNGLCLGRQSNRLSVWQIQAVAELDFGDPEQIKVNVVYDKERHTIVTFLPQGITDALGVSIGDRADEMAN